MRLSWSSIPALLLLLGEAHSHRHVFSRSSGAILAREDVNPPVLRGKDDRGLQRGVASGHHWLQRRQIQARALARRTLQNNQVYEFPDAAPTYRKVIVNDLRAKGAVGEVWAATSVLNPDIHCAIKYTHTPFWLFLKESKHEDEYFKKVQGLPHIVQRLASKKKRSADGTEVTESILLELCDGTLADQIAQYPHREESWNQRLKEHLVGILEGLVSLHELKEPMAHGDIKPDNVLLKNGIIKLGDLGLATDKLESNEQAGNDQWISPWGLAPEGAWPNHINIKTDEYHTHYDTRKKDVWSVGITMVQMISGGHPPWKRADHKEYTQKFLHEEDYLLQFGVSPDANRLLRDKVFVPKDSDRITARQFLDAVKKITLFTTLAPPPLAGASSSRRSWWRSGASSSRGTPGSWWRQGKATKRSIADSGAGTEQGRLVRSRRQAD